MNAWKALLTTVQSELALVFPATDMGIEQPPGMPRPSAGEQYFAIWPSLWEPGADNTLIERGIHEVFGFTITLTRRAGIFPSDSYGDKLFLEDWGKMDSMSRACHKLVARITKQADLIMCRANAAITEGDVFRTPPRWQGTSMMEGKGPDWFRTEASNEPIDFGFAMDVRFGGMERYQSLESIG